MKAVLINPKDKTVTDVEITGELQHYYKLIECHTITHAPLTHVKDMDGHKFTLYVDDEGLFRDVRYHFTIAGRCGTLVGNGIMVGHDGEGNSIDCPLTAAEVALDIEFV